MITMMVGLYPTAYPITQHIRIIPLIEAVSYNKPTTSTHETPLLNSPPLLLKLPNHEGITPTRCVGHDPRSLRSILRALEVVVIGEGTEASLRVRVSRRHEELLQAALHIVMGADGIEHLLLTERQPALEEDLPDRQHRLAPDHAAVRGVLEQRRYLAITVAIALQIQISHPRAVHLAHGLPLDHVAPQFHLVRERCVVPPELVPALRADRAVAPPEPPLPRCVVLARTRRDRRVLGCVGAEGRSIAREICLEEAGEEAPPNAGMGDVETAKHVFLPCGVQLFPLEERSEVHRLHDAEVAGVTDLETRGVRPLQGVPGHTVGWHPLLVAELLGLQRGHAAPPRREVLRVVASPHEDADVEHAEVAADPAARLLRQLGRLPPARLLARVRHVVAIASRAGDNAALEAGDRRHEPRPAPRRRRLYPGAGLQRHARFRLGREADPVASAVVELPSPFVLLGDVRDRHVARPDGLGVLGLRWGPLEARR